MRSKTEPLISTFVYLSKSLPYLEMCLFYIMSSGLWNVVSFLGGRFTLDESLHKPEFASKKLNLISK